MLTTHALVGAAAASVFPQQPLVAFAAGFASHFAIDALPHWDYKILSMDTETDHTLNADMHVNKYFFLDLARTGSDALLGLLLSTIIFSLWIFHLPLTIVLLGACAGITPDFLQFVYFKTRFAILTPLQRFHIWVQKGKSIYPPAIVGMAYQAALVLVIVVALKVSGVT
jgi:hypothetical protein